MLGGTLLLASFTSTKLALTRDRFASKKSKVRGWRTTQKIVFKVKKQNMRSFEPASLCLLCSKEKWNRSRLCVDNDVTSKPCCTSNKKCCFRGKWRWSSSCFEINAKMVNYKLHSYQVEKKIWLTLSHRSSHILSLFIRLRTFMYHQRFVNQLGVVNSCIHFQF